MPTALVHDYLLVLRGAERTFGVMAEAWPTAPLYTLLYDDAGTCGAFAHRTVHTSPLQRLRVRQKGFRRMLPLFPWGVEALDLTDADLVLSSSSAFAHGVRKPIGAQHVCYCHSPFRYAWHERRSELETAPRALRAGTRLVLDRIRSWDEVAAQRVDHYIANSAITRERIREFYRRDAPVIHPPVDTERFEVGEAEDWFLVVGELVRHKRTEIALQAAERADVPIKVVGCGPALAALSARYGDHAEFLGRISDEELARVMPRARAVVVPNVEEFGIVAVEAQAAGRPVVGLRAGGTSETVIDGETGVLLDDQDPETFAEALRGMDFDAFDPFALQRHAETFGRQRFQERLRQEIEQVTGGAGDDLKVMSPAEPFDTEEARELAVGAAPPPTTPRAATPR
jgi:glycosyltransferase involved in cell wall biosynthesis